MPFPGLLNLLAEVVEKFPELNNISGFNISSINKGFGGYQLFMSAISTMDMDTAFVFCVREGATDLKLGDTELCSMLWIDHSLIAMKFCSVSPSLQ